LKEIKAFKVNEEIPDNAKFICKEVKDDMQNPYSVFYYEIKIVKKTSSKTKVEDTETIERVISYLNKKLQKKEGTGYSSTSIAAVKNIKARLKSGKNPEDFKIVIDNMYAKWFHNDDMRQYLRPETLFGNKFDSYLVNVEDDNSQDDIFGDLENVIGEIKNA